MPDDVKRMLTEFADQAVGELPPADVDADVTRGRRALYRLRYRRRGAAVLGVVAAATLVVAIGNPLRWWGGEAGVATAPSSGSPSVSIRPPATTLTSTPRIEASTYALPAPVALVANRQAWPVVDCRLTPAGWRTQPADGAVLLAPAYLATVRKTDLLVMRSSVEPDKLNAVKAVQGSGRVVHLGRAVSGERVGQVKLGERWMVVTLPVAESGWTDATLLRLISSCALR